MGLTISHAEYVCRIVSYYLHKKIQYIFRVQRDIQEKDVFLLFLLKYNKKGKMFSHLSLTKKSKGSLYYNIILNK